MIHATAALTPAPCPRTAVLVRHRAARRRRTLASSETLLEPVDVVFPRSGTYLRWALSRTCFTSQPPYQHTVEWPTRKDRGKEPSPRLLAKSFHSQSDAPFFGRLRGSCFGGIIPDAIDLPPEKQIDDGVRDGTRPGAGR